MAEVAGKRVQASVLQEFCGKAFKAAGVSPSDAELVSRSLIQAELRGIGSHGVMRLSTYLRKIKEGGFNLHPNVRVLRERAGTAVLEGDAGLGAVLGQKAMRLCIEKAKNTGIAAVSVRNANHYGYAAFYGRMAVAEGMIGITCCNTPAKMGVYGGAENLLGTNPLCIAVPATEPFIFDGATSVVARGKIMYYSIAGLPIPSHWACDTDGRPTTDAKVALKGVQQAFGEYKGSGIAIAVEILSAALSGARFSYAASELFSDYEKPQGLGLFFAAFDVSAFAEPSVFRASMDELMGKLRSSKRAVGYDEIVMPGELEARAEMKNLKEGIPLPPDLLKDMIAIAADYRLDDDPSNW
ncbi:MAG: Ldh family oxidoreductase [Treponemataceae bacterium]